MAEPATRLEIDLDAIAANFHHLAARNPGGRAAAVVKADAYGTGAARVAARLWREGCADFCVATGDEGAALRAMLPTARIFILNGLYAGAAPDYAERGLIPALGSLGEIDAWAAESRRRGHALAAVLHVDTGMNRLGLPEAEIAVLHQDPERLAGLDLRYVMTHLVSADSAGAASNPAQLARFRAACARLPAAPTSIAASSGLFLAGFGSDLARPGAGLYGLNPTPNAANPMRQVVRLAARILQIRDIATGESVGYDATWQAARPSRIATLGVGYADGWLRALGNRAIAHFDGAPVPLVGRVSMDLTTFDVTDLPSLAPGDWLELIGPASPPDAVARAAGTIGYEILTSLGRRYHRVWREA